MRSVSNPIFELRHVSRCFDGVQALDGVRLCIWPEEMVALVGPSGAGKTTLLNLLNGSLPPSAGEVLAFGRELARLAPSQRRRIQARIGTIYQQFQLVDNLRVVHNVNAGHLGRWPLWKAALSLVWPREVARAAQALSQVGILEKLHARTGSLSGGQQQRVALARVLVQNPDVILADEPVSSVDPERSREILALLQRLNREKGKTVVVSLHVIEYAFRYCRRIIGLRGGRVQFDAPVEAVTPAMVRALYALEELGTPDGANSFLA